MQSAKLSESILKPVIRTATFSLLVIGVVLCTGKVYAITAYDVNAGTIGNQNFGGALGMEFDVNQPVLVTHLGVFDDGQDGLATTIVANLWDRNNIGAPIASAGFAAGNTGALIDGSRFLPLANPLLLPAGFQGTMAAGGYNANEQNGNTGGAPAVNWSTNDGGGLLTFVGTSRFDGNPIAYPGTPDGGPVNRYAAGTFMFQAALPAAAVPEPSTAVLCAIGLMGLGLCTWRRGMRRAKRC